MKVKVSRRSEAVEEIVGGLAAMLAALRRSGGRESTSVETLIAQAEAALERAEAGRVALREQHASEMQAVNEEVERIRRGIVALSRTARMRTTPVRPFAVQAGPAALEAVMGALRRRPRSQRQVVVDTGLNEGTVSYAIRGLLEAGAIEPTGESVQKSRVFRLVEQPGTVSRSLYDRAREIVAEQHVTV